MLTKERFVKISEKHGEYASWAVWAEEGSKPKSNIGDLRIFDLEHNSSLLEQLNPNVVMVGLNFSRKTKMDAFANFHDRSPHGQDYKIRFAFRNTKFYGAYMTDIIKNFEEKSSDKVAKHLKLNLEFERQNIELFRNELSDLQTKDPLIIAFGVQTYSILKRHLINQNNIVRIPHYSMQIGKEKYRQTVLGILERY